MKRAIISMVDRERWLGNPANKEQRTHLEVEQGLTVHVLKIIEIFNKIHTHIYALF